jgi:hypothetical protein
MIPLDPILLADQAEEEAAHEALRATTTRDELVSVWWRDAERFEGAARERLSETYAEKLRALGALSP